MDQRPSSLVRRYTRIGQQLERIAEVVDYISPMLYPSSFQFVIPAYRNPVQHPDGSCVGLSNGHSSVRICPQCVSDHQHVDALEPAQPLLAGRRKTRCASGIVN